MLMKLEKSRLNKFAGAAMGLIMGSTAVLPSLTSAAHAEDRTSYGIQGVFKIPLGGTADNNPGPQFGFMGGVQFDDGTDSSVSFTSGTDQSLSLGFGAMFNLRDFNTNDIAVNRSYTDDTTGLGFSENGVVTPNNAFTGGLMRGTYFAFAGFEDQSIGSLASTNFTVGFRPINQFDETKSNFSFAFNGIDVAGFQGLSQSAGFVAGSPTSVSSLNFAGFNQMGLGLGTGTLSPATTTTPAPTPTTTQPTQPAPVTPTTVQPNPTPTTPVNTPDPTPTTGTIGVGDPGPNGGGTLTPCNACTTPTTPTPTPEDDSNNTWLYVGGAVLVAGAVALLASRRGENQPAPAAVEESCSFTEQGTKDAGYQLVTVSDSARQTIFTANSRLEADAAYRILVTNGARTGDGRLVATADESCADTSAAITRAVRGAPVLAAN